MKYIFPVGKPADVENIGDHGRSRVRPPRVVTPLQGIRAAVSDAVEVVLHDGRKIDAAKKTARDADVVVVVAGYTHNDEGECLGWLLGGGDRDCLTVHAHDEALIQAVALTTPKLLWL